MSDIYPDAVRFQHEHFGVAGVPSTANPVDLQLTGEFDLIFVSSLFSHLPERTFQPWLAKLVSLLSKRGILIFTTHGTSPSDPDFVFTPESESRTLDTAEYGKTLVSEKFVAKCLSELADTDLCWRRVEHGHLAFQDWYMVSRDSRSNLSSLPYRRGFSGHVGGCWKDQDGGFHLRGWAADFDSDEPPVRIEVYDNDDLVHECVPDHDRPDVAKLFGARTALRSGWACKFHVIERDAAS